MALTAASIVTAVARDLNDPGNANWSEDDLLDYLNSAQRAAVLLNQDVLTVNTLVELDAGTRQTPPDDCYMLLDVVRNMGTDIDNPVPGRAVIAATMDAMDETPKWHLVPDRPGSMVRNFVYDTRDRNHYYISPAVMAGTVVEIKYSAIPQTIVREGSALADETISVDDIYEPALRAFMMHKAYAKESAVEGAGEERAAAYYGRFMSLLQGGDTSALEQLKDVLNFDVRQGNIAQREMS